VKVLYSFNKVGKEADLWERELSRASTSRIQIVPFNHQAYVDPNRYLRAQLLDNLYYDRNPNLLRLYDDIKAQLLNHRADALLVDNCPPYHPEFLRGLSVYKMLRICDGPVAAYDRDFAYLHAYDHILFHSPAYSRDLTMARKLEYCGARKSDLWPLWLFDSAYDPSCDEARIRSAPRPKDIVFVGALHRDKMESLAKIKRHFRSRCTMYGLSSVKRNLYFNLRHGMPGWIKPIGFDQYVSLYQQAKIGFNVHNRGKFTVGNFRMFELPANGVMQISDGGEYLQEFFAPGAEIVGADEVDRLIEHLEYFLAHEQLRIDIAIQGYRAVLGRHRLAHRIEHLADMLESALA
jgi:hypothetical protein